MAHRLFLFTAVILLIIIKDGGTIRLLKIGVPSSVEKDKETELTCEYALETDHLYSVKWYKDDNEFFRYVPKDTPKAQVFPFPGVHVDLHRSNDKRVILTRTELNSSGVYRCEVSAEAPSFETVYKESEMRIIDIPKDPPVIKGGKPNYHVGDTLNVNCTSRPSAPAASLMWYINGNEALREYMREYVPEKKPDGLQEAKLGLRFRVNEAHFRHGQMSLKCTATIATNFWDQKHRALIGKRTSYDNPSAVVGAASVGIASSYHWRLVGWSWFYLVYIPCISFSCLWPFRFYS